MRVRTISGSRRSRLSPPWWWTVVGALVARKLSQVPENLVKSVVGMMLCSFGLFWVGEGAGLHWPGSGLCILVLVGVFGLSTAWRRTCCATQPVAP